MTVITCTGCFRTLTKKVIPDDPRIRYWQKDSVPEGLDTLVVWADLVEYAVVCPHTDSTRHEPNRPERRELPPQEARLRMARRLLQGSLVWIDCTQPTACGACQGCQLHGAIREWLDDTSDVRAGADK